jgi:hypothetical protein
VCMCVFVFVCMCVFVFVDAFARARARVCVCVCVRACVCVCGGRVRPRRTRGLEGQEKIGSAHHPEADLRQRSIAPRGRRRRAARSCGFHAKRDRRRPHAPHAPLRNVPHWRASAQPTVLGYSLAARVLASDAPSARRSAGVTTAAGTRRTCGGGCVRVRAAARRPASPAARASLRGVHARAQGWRASACA